MGQASVALLYAQQDAQAHEPAKDNAWYILDCASPSAHLRHTHQPEKPLSENFLPAALFGASRTADVFPARRRDLG